MAPNLLGNSAVFLQNSAEPIQIIGKPGLQHEITKAPPKSAAQQRTAPQNKPQYPKWEIAWFNVIGFIYLHTFTIYGVYLMFTAAQWRTNTFTILALMAASQGVTAGAHRLWAHRTYKAKLPLRILLAYLQTMAFQNHIYEWVRDHRMHHKYTDTNADPHNATRGFFFSHIGWLMVKKHPDVKLKSKNVDCSDLLEDPVVRFQMKYYLILMPVLCFLIPTLIPWYFWNENILISWYIAAVTRYTIQLNGTWFVNSAAHLWGNRPYDKSIFPRNNTFVGIIAFGEGWHNYHHVFPWDYKAAELGTYAMNMTTGCIDMFAKIGWAYDLKTASEEMILKRMKRTGDGSHKYGTGPIPDPPTEEHSHYGDHLWGWGDQDMKDEERQDVKHYNDLKED